MDAPFRIVAAGDSAVIAEFEDRIDPAVNAQAIALADAVRAAQVPGIRDVVPSFRSVAVYFDPLRTNLSALLEMLEVEGGRTRREPSAPREPLRIPVCYGGEFGPDLAAVAEFSGLTEE